MLKPRSTGLRSLTPVSLGAAVLLGVCLLPSPCTGQILSVPQMARATPPPSEAEFAPVLLQLQSSDGPARIQALWQLGNFNLNRSQADAVIPLIRPLLRQWPSPPFAAGSLSLQTAAIIALWGVGPEGTAALPEVIAALDFPEIGIRDTAMNAVFRMRLRGADATRVMPSVVRLLEYRPASNEDQQHSSVVDKALRWLAEVGPEGAPATAALVRQLAIEPIADRHRSAVQALRGIGPAARDALPVMLVLFESPAGESFHWYLAQALIEIGLHDPRTWDTILPAFVREIGRLPKVAPEAGIYAPEFMRLRIINGMLAWFDPSDPLVMRALVGAIRGAPEWSLGFAPMDDNGASIGPVRPKALGNLLESLLHAPARRQPEAERELIDLVRTSREGSAAERLGLLGLQSRKAIPAEFLPRLRRELGGNRAAQPGWNPWAYAALRSMGTLAAPAVPDLRAQLRDGNPAYKSAAADVLASIGPPAAAAAIAELEAVAREDARTEIAATQLGIYESLLTLDPRSQVARDGLLRVVGAGRSSTSAVEGTDWLSVEAHRILLEHAPDPDSARAALSTLMNAQADNWAAVAASVLARDRRSPAIRAVAIDRLYALLSPFAQAMAAPIGGVPPGAVPEAQQAAIGLEGVLPGDPASEARMLALVQQLWSAQRMQESPARDATPAALRTLVRILTQFETKSEATQKLLLEMRGSSSFLLREAAAGR